MPTMPMIICSKQCNFKHFKTVASTTILKVTTIGYTDVRYYSIALNFLLLAKWLYKIFILIVFCFSYRPCYLCNRE